MKNFLPQIEKANKELEEKLKEVDSAEVTIDKDLQIDSSAEETDDEIDDQECDVSYSIL